LEKPSSLVRFCAMPTPFNTASLAALSAASLRGPWPTTKTIKGGDVWNDKRPTVVYAIRRMG